MTLFDGEPGPAVQPSLSTSSVGLAEVTHAAIRAQLSDYLTATLDQRERARLDEHLLHCPSCQAYRRTLQATTELGSSLPRVAASTAAKQRLLDIPDA